MGLKKKAFFFTVDALLAASILLGGILILSSSYINKQPTAHLNYLSQDILNSLNIIQLNELSNSYVNELYANGNITDLSNSILHQVGEFWAAEKYTIAEKFVENITQDIISDRYGFGIWVSSDLIFQRDSPPPYARTSAKKLISGIEKNRPIKGYMSKAQANTFTGTGFIIIPFSPEGSGWKGSQADPSDGIIDKYFEIPAGTIITSATFYISLHIQSGGDDWELININDGTCIITKDELIFGTGDGVFDIKNIDGCIQTGMNHIRLRLRNLGYNAHVHPGTYVKVDYSLNGSIPTYGTDYSKRYYLDNVISYEGSSKESGVFQIVPFFIPEDAIDINVTAHIEGRNINDYTGTLRFPSWDGWKKMKDYDYMFFINNDEPFDSDDHPSLNPVYDYSSAQLQNQLITGTNVVSIYFNNYGDRNWGNGMPQIYSDVINDPENSSYIDVTYSLANPPAPYGSIKVMQMQEFGGEADWIMQTNFSFPLSASSMGNVFLHLTQQYSYMVDVEADIYNPPLNTAFESPSARAVPTTTYIPKNFLDLSPVANNYIRVSDRKGNDILPNTAVEYSFFVPAFVGFNGVFTEQTEAENDALDRLNSTMGAFFGYGNIVIESSAMRGVPSMWGPAVMEVRAWH